MPSRYEPAGGPIARRCAAFVDRFGPDALRLAARLMEIVILGRSSPLRGGLKWLLRSHVEAVAPAFQSAFYVRQFEEGPRRQRVERDALLHYLMIGQFEGRSPQPAYDPTFMMRRFPAPQSGLGRFRAYLEQRSGRNPANEVACDAEAGRWQAGRAAVLTMHHARGGGSSHCLALYEKRIRLDGQNVLRLRGVPLAPGLAVIEDPAVGCEALSQVFDMATGRRQLVEYARSRGVERLLVNHLVDRPAESLEWIRDLSTQLNCPYDVVLHDYYALCPRIDLVNGAGRFCGVARPEECVRCVSDYGSDAGDSNPSNWRRDFLEFLQHADRLIVPSEDLAARMGEHLPSKRMTVWPPEDDGALPPVRLPRLRADEPLRVVTLGALTISKGARVVRALARQAGSTGAPISIEVLGPSPEAGLLKQAGVKVAGHYSAEALPTLISDADPHVVFLPAIWPETWSFVLTSALRRGLPVVAFDIGAPAQRLRALGRGHLLPVELAAHPAELLAAFMVLRRDWVGP